MYQKSLLLEKSLTSEISKFKFSYFHILFIYFFKWNLMFSSDVFIYV